MHNDHRPFPPQCLPVQHALQPFGRRIEAHPLHLRTRQEIIDVPVQAFVGAQVTRDAPS